MSACSILDTAREAFGCYVLYCLPSSYSFLQDLVGNALIQDLTDETFQDAVKGKNWFVKFYAPWCGHCKALAPKWHRLMDMYESSPAGLIGKVDCTKSKKTCASQGVAGYPTLKYYVTDAESKSEDASDEGASAAKGKMYEGGREFEELLSFVEKHFGSACSFKQKDMCSEDELSIIDEATAMTQKERSKEIEDLKLKRDEAVEVYNTRIKKLQLLYEKAGKQRDKRVGEIAPRHRIFQSVANALDGA